MQIFGIGTDIVNIDRIAKIIKKNKTKFIRKVFTKNEIFYCNSKKNSTPYYAKRFAAKEAFVKALGVGFYKGLSFKDVIIYNNQKGKPVIKLSIKSKKIVDKILKNKDYSIFLSMSDDIPWAIATVIINLNDSK